uniref:Uncharacterized protein n=1 Tax=Brassica oleracea TaxID=3712 RepID=A0A3P6FZI7_BRAOL|nr:unnamed protein product [Brassica oleracea]
MGKGPGLYTDIGKSQRDLLYKDHNSDQKLSITTHSPAGVVSITSTGTKKVTHCWEMFLSNSSKKTSLPISKFPLTIAIYLIYSPQHLCVRF